VSLTTLDSICPDHKEEPMTVSRFFARGVAVLVLVIVAIGCKKTPIEEEETFEPQLLLSQLSVAVVPDGTQEVTVTATDEYDSPRPFTVVCDDEAVATVVTSDSTMTITGHSCGATTVTVTCDTNVRTLPVQVYDAKILEAGELLIAFVDEFEYRWCSMGSGDTWVASFYHPVTTDGYHALGSLGLREFSDPNGKKSIVVVNARPGSDALKPPVDYDSVWNTRGSGIEDYGSLWNPVPPAGYKALGTVAQRGFDKPGLDDVVCVREDLTVPGGCGQGLFRGNNGRAECELYVVDPPIVGPHDSCYLTTGASTGTRTRPDSTGHPALNVLKVKLPMMAEAPDQSFAPKLTGYDKPPDETPPVMSREMSVPWTLIQDRQHAEVWRYTNSPNYRVERQVFYRLLYHNYNQTSELQTNNWKITSGVSRDSSYTEWEQKGLSLSVEAGVSYQGLAWGGHLTVTGTVSKDFGYQTQVGITEFMETEVTTSINIPPGKAAALWQKYNRFMIKRHDGKDLEPVATYDCGINSYVTDEFPHDE
jgi:hypothetical protein